MQPNKETSLQATLKEVIGETVSSPANPSVNETNEGVSSGTNVETNAGEPTKEYISGIDISDIPAQDRARIKVKLEEKAKLLESGYNKKFQEVATFAKAQKDLQQMGLTVDEARDVLSKHMQSKQNPVKATEAKKETLRTLDNLINSAPPEQQSALQQMRQIILEETDISTIKNDLAEMKKFMHGQHMEVANKRQTQLMGEIDQLKIQYGPELVEKHQDAILKEGMNYNTSARRLLHAIAEPDEIEQAVLSSKSKTGNKTITQDKLNAISSQSQSISGSSENIDLKKVKMKDLLSGLVAKK